MTNKYRGLIRILSLLAGGAIVTPDPQRERAPVDERIAWAFMALLALLAFVSLLLLWLKVTGDALH
jgi:hypothetical protein